MQTHVTGGAAASPYSELVVRTVGFHNHQCNTGVNLVVNTRAHRESDAIRCCVAAVVMQFLSGLKPIDVAQAMVKNCASHVLQPPPAIRIGIRVYLASMLRSFFPISVRDRLLVALQGQYRKCRLDVR